MIRIGNYIFYPAFFILIGAMFVALLIVIALVNILNNKKQENNINEHYEITTWQRKHLCRLMTEYIEDNDLKNAFLDTISKLRKYINDNKYWNLDELLEIDDNIVKYTTLLLFEIAKQEYLDNHNDNAVLILNAIDFINGGMDNPDYYDGPYPWIGEDIPEMRNHQDMTDEEARTVYIYESAVEDLYSYVDDDLDKIPEKSDVLDFCKRLSKQDIQNASGDLCSIIDILEINTRTRDVVAKALFNSISTLLGSVFDDEDSDNVKYMDEYRRYQIRALAAVIDNQLYSDVVDSIDK